MGNFVHFNGDIFYTSTKRLKICNDHVEYYEYGKEYFVGGKPRTNKEKTKNDPTPPDILKEKRYKRAKRNIIDLTNCNSRVYKNKKGRMYKPVFTTLTFGENQQYIKKANYEFTKFIQRLNLAVIGQKNSFLKYLTVIEFQKDFDFYGRKKKNGGSIHYHTMFFNLPFRRDNKKIFEEKWNLGFVKIQGANRIKNVGKYMTKYMVKDLGDPRLQGEKSYFASKELKKPIIVNFDELITPVLDMFPEKSIEYEKKNIPIEYLESLNYRVYNLRNFSKEKRKAIDFLNNYDYYTEIADGIKIKKEEINTKLYEKPIILPKVDGSGGQTSFIDRITDV